MFVCSPIIAFVREPINFTGVNNFRFYGVRVQCHKTAADLVFFFTAKAENLKFSRYFSILSTCDPFTHFG